MQNIALPSEPALQEILQDILTETGIPGIGAAISLRGEILSVAAGTSALDTKAPLTTTSRFEMSCLMKFFVSLIVLDLAAGGILDLDLSIGTFLPELGDDNGGKSGAITLRHLLSHTGGYRGLDITDMQTRWNCSWDRFVKLFSELPPSFPAGSTFNYEHSEHVVLGEILHRVTGHKARDLVRRQIFDPLNIETGNARSDKADPARFIANHVLSPTTGNFSPLSIPPFGIFWDASLPDCTITLQDIAHVATALMPKGGSAKALFPPSVLAQLGPPLIAIPQGVRSDRQSEQIPQSFGAGCAQYGDNVLGHNGSMLGQTCALRFDPRADMAVVIGVNARSTFARDTALQRIWTAMTDGQARVPDQPANRTFRLEEMLNGFSLNQVSGHYVGSYLGEVTVAGNADGIRFDVGPPGNRRSSFQVLPPTKDGNNAYRIESRSPVSAIFFPDPVTHAPSLFLGVHSYKKNP